MMTDVTVEAKMNVSCFPILSVATTSSPAEFIHFWCRFYDGTNESLYLDRINKPQFTVEDVEKLFVWKNGMTLSRPKQKTVRNITGRIEVINELKRYFDLDAFLSEFKKLSTIWKIFLLHIITPGRYPVFDQHVGRAYLFFAEGVVAEIPTADRQKEGLYFDRYLGFFEGLASQDVDRKEMDEGLWVFGKWLKSPIASGVVKAWLGNERGHIPAKE